MESKIVFVTSFPPRECGIATFTTDLTNAIKNQMDSSIEIEICALEGASQRFDYPTDVKYILDTSQPSQYIEISKKINNDKQVKAVMIEHEFGLFGGEYGDYLMYMMDTLEKPVVITFHSVLPCPDKKRLQTVQDITEKAKSILVMTLASREILIAYYLIPPEKIKVVPHGTHHVRWKQKQKAKDKFKFNHRPVLSTFGLLGRNKSIETAIDALPEIKKQFPDVLYIVLGKTHPCLVKEEGESYREFLEEKTKQLGLIENVQFVNRFLELDELLDYLSITDIYLFTSKDPNQAVSGTFAYAMSSACPIIATPIPHASELLSEDTGILVDFEQPAQVANAAIRLLSDQQYREQMGSKAFHKTRFTIWENVANHTMELFRPFIEHANFCYRIPPINLNHIKHLTTERGIIQFSNIDIADLDSGYTLDDNARAMIALTSHYEMTGEASDLKLIHIYLDFIRYCQKTDGSFNNYVDYNGNFNILNNSENLEDSNGRAIWSLGFLLSKNIFDKQLIDKAKKYMQIALQNVEHITSPRAMAFIIKGLYFYSKNNNDREISRLINRFAERLVGCYNKVANKDWQWFEEYLTYANAVLPEAMLCAWKTTGKNSYRVIAKATFDFLLGTTFKEGRIKVISNKGWFYKNQKPTEDVGEQPIDVAYTILALDLFYSELSDNKYINKLNIAFDWFLGRNHLNQVIYNRVTGGCYDGVEKDGVNLNQGAESTLSYLLARQTKEKYRIIHENPSDLSSISINLKRLKKNSQGKIQNVNN